MHNILGGDDGRDQETGKLQIQVIIDPNTCLYNNYNF